MQPTFRTPPFARLGLAAITLGTPALLNLRHAKRQTFKCPVFRHLAQPPEGRVFHGGEGIEALGDGVTDKGLAFHLEPFD